MKLTLHAQQRTQQRRVTSEAIDLAIGIGVETRGRNGASVYRLDDRTLRNLGPAYERMRGVTVVESNHEVITVWKRADSRRRGNGRRRREAVRERELARDLRDLRNRSAEQPCTGWVAPTDAGWQADTVEIAPDPRRNRTHDAA